METHPRTAMAKAITLVLPSRDPRSGFWAATERNGYDVPSVWDSASEALATVFTLTPTEVRDFLDGPAGRFLADDLPFIEGGPVDPDAIEALIRARLSEIGWQRLYAKAVSDARASKAPDNGTGWTPVKTGSRRRRPSHRSID